MAKQTIPPLILLYQDFSGLTSGKAAYNLAASPLQTHNMKYGKSPFKAATVTRFKKKKKFLKENLLKELTHLTLSYPVTHNPKQTNQLQKSH